MDNLEASVPTAVDQSMAGSVTDGPFEEAGAQKKKKNPAKMTCFSCNRLEYHSSRSKRRRLYFYIVGMTFGLSVFIGPFFCSCCGSSRLMCRDWMSLRYWLRQRRNKRRSSGR